MLYPCPACGFEVFEEPAGSYAFCPVCHWEDDEVQLRFPAMRGGANKQSLYEWQLGALQRLPLHITAHDGYSRCSDWRPLTQEECSDTSGTPTSGRILRGGRG
jgi:Cysteine-rich CPCC